MGDILTGGLKAILAFLPDSPFAEVLDELAGNAQITQLLGMVNWFIPFYLFVPVLTAWGVCVGVYYVYQIALRWFNAIE